MANTGKIKVVTAAVEEPVTLAEAKNHLRVTITEDDSWLDSLAVAARRRAESFCGRQFITQTFDYWLDRFPAAGQIELPRPPLQSITSIQYQDTNDATQTFAASKYQALTYDAAPGVIDLDWGESWPVTYDKADAVVIRFVAGYGLAQSVPEEIKAAIKLFIEYEYDRPEDRFGVQGSRIIGAAESLLWFDRELAL